MSKSAYEQNDPALNLDVPLTPRAWPIWNNFLGNLKCVLANLMSPGGPSAAAVSGMHEKRDGMCDGREASQRTVTHRWFIFYFWEVGGALAFFFVFVPDELVRERLVHAAREASHAGRVWASPPCTEYSPAKTHGVRDLASADRIAQAALNIINLAEPRVWFLENPHTMLFKRSFMQSISHLRQRCTYCRYGLQYKKDTDVWSNIALELKHCDVAPCASKLAHGLHQRTTQQSTSGPHHIPGVPQHVANCVPIQLLRVLINTAIAYLKACDERITWK
jgi:hypothetical protein